MKIQRNLSYNISILAFLLVMSTAMVTSSPFQMLLDVNPSFKSNLSFKLANAADEEEAIADLQGFEQNDVKDEESEQEFDQTSFEELGGNDDAAKQDDVKDEESEQEFDQTSFEELGGNDDAAKQDDVKDEESEQEFDQTSFEELGGNDDAAKQDDVKDEESEQEFDQTSFEELGGNDDAAKQDRCQR